MGSVGLEGLSKQFQLSTTSGLRTVHALQDVSFSVGDGEVVALIGPSGCGKTTALRVIMGLEPASSGRVLVDNVPIRGCGHDRGMVFQHAQLLPWLTALENVCFGLEMKGLPRAEIAERAARALDLVGLAPSRDQRPHQLSGGMQQRVGIARALAIDPKVLLMDEPFGALDAQTRESLQEELIAIHERDPKTIVFVTHDLDEAVLLADRAIVLMGGQLSDIVPIPLPRPRGDLGAVRALPAFAATRLLLWERLHAKPQAARRESVVS